MKWLVAALFLATPALGQTFNEDGDYYPPSAQEAPRYVGDGEFTHPGLGASGQYVVRVTPSETHFADVFFQNRLVRAIDVPDSFDFAFEGLIISVIIDSGDGMVPDRITVIPPDGYYALPADAVVNENESIIIEIHEALLG